jgi:hypothetical protein
MVISNDAYTFYLDGVADGSGTFSNPTGDCSVGASIASNMQIGVRAKDGGDKDSNLLTGSIQHVMQFNEAKNPVR